MRLINAETYRLEEFFGRPAPPYAILSHTWGDDEVFLSDMDDPATAQKKDGFAKIEYCCRQAGKDGLDWAWVDTCCIDKSSSAELSETINSMFRYYSGAMVCYAYLSDIDAVQLSGCDSAAALAKRLEKEARWFRRGWTLQEFIAPYSLTFFATDWTPLVSKADWRESLRHQRLRLQPLDQGNASGDDDGDGEELTSVAGIPLAVLLKAEPLSQIPVATRMRWARRRQTTRAEDIAYCLLGILGVNMPLLYGEGGRAFFRLQEEVLRKTEDYSVLAWSGLTNKLYCAFIANHPGSFSDLNGKTTRFRSWLDLVHRIAPPVFSSRGLTATLPMRRVSSTPRNSRKRELFDLYREPQLNHALGEEAEDDYGLYSVALPCLASQHGRAWAALTLNCIDIRGGRVRHGHPELVRFQKAGATVPPEQVLSGENGWQIRTCYLKVSNEDLPRTLHGGRIEGWGTRDSLFLFFRSSKVEWGRPCPGWEIVNQRAVQGPDPWGLYTTFGLRNAELLVRQQTFGPVITLFSTKDMRVTIIYPHHERALVKGGRVAGSMEQAMADQDSYRSDNEDNTAGGVDGLVTERFRIFPDDRNARGPLWGKKIRIGGGCEKALSITLVVKETAHPQYYRIPTIVLSIC